MSGPSPINDGDSIQIRIPMQMKRRGGRKEIVVPEGLEEPQDPNPTSAL